VTKVQTCRLKAKLHLLATAEGGRQTAIARDVYRPQFHLGSSSASCRVDEMERDPLAPGQEGEVKMTLLHPERFGAELRSGSKFEIWEGGRVVGWGVIEDVSGLD
jgi:translation elongation factor EF-Tu-like GTPase